MDISGCATRDTRRRRSSAGDTVSAKAPRRAATYSSTSNTRKRARVRSSDAFLWTPWDQMPSTPRGHSDVAPSTAQRLTLTVDDTHRVSALLQLPSSAHACLVLAHGAGAGMEHSFMDAVANEFE